MVFWSVKKTGEKALLQFSQIKGGMFAFGNATLPLQVPLEQKKADNSLLHCTAATSVFPLPVGPLILYQLHPLSKVLAPTIPDSTAFPISGVHYIPLGARSASVLAVVCSLQHWFFLLFLCTRTAEWKGELSTTGYRQSPVVPAAPFIHNSMVSCGISRTINRFRS